MIRTAAEYLRGHIAEWPKIALVLGSAQASFADSLEDAKEIAYRDIPNWPVPRVEGHAGKLIVGKSAGTPVAVLSGRVHLYEGWTPQQVTFGIRVLRVLGVKTLVLTNAAGGINPAYHAGLLVLISDHINLQGSNPLIGQNEDSLGPRFPDMSNAYSPRLREKVKAAAQSEGVELGEGVYAAMLGPSFETPAEILYLRTIGADLAGMSTVPETIVANHMGMEVLGISTVTNMAAGMQKKLSHAEVLETGQASAGALIRLLKRLLAGLDS